MRAFSYRLCRSLPEHLLRHVDPFFLTFDIHPPADPIPAGLDDDGPVLTFATIHGLSPFHRRFGCVWIKMPD